MVGNMLNIEAQFVLAPMGSLQGQGQALTWE